MAEVLTYFGKPERLWIENSLSIPDGMFIICKQIGGFNSFISGDVFYDAVTKSILNKPAEVVTFIGRIKHENGETKDFSFCLNFEPFIGRIEQMRKNGRMLENLWFQKDGRLLTFKGIKPLERNRINKQITPEGLKDSKSSNQSGLIFHEGKKRQFVYYYFYEYLPTRFEATEEQQKVRRLVYSFKDGFYNSVYNSIKTGMSEIIEGNRSNWILCCIPASTKQKTQVRFKALCNQLCHSLKIQNGYAAISVSEDHEAQHISGHKDDILGKLSINTSIIKGKKIILMDDVITRGKTFFQIATKLKTEDASDVVGFFVAKTINPDL